MRDRILERWTMQERQRRIPNVNQCKAPVDVIFKSTKITENRKETVTHFTLHCYRIDA